MRRNHARQKFLPPKANRRPTRESRSATDKIDEVETALAAVAALTAASQGLAALLQSTSAFRRNVSTENQAAARRRLRCRPAPKRPLTLASSLKRKAASVLLPPRKKSRVRRKVESTSSTGMPSTVEASLEMLETARGAIQKALGARVDPPGAVSGKPLRAASRRTAKGDATKNSVAKPVQPGQKVAGCRLAESRAAWILEQSARQGRKITDTDMIGVLDAWSFKENKARVNVIPNGKKFVHSEMLGLVRIRAFSKYVVAKPTQRFPLVTRLLCRFLEDNPPKGLNNRMRFPFSTVCINRDYAAKRHRDSNNMGMSIVRALGNFTGGRLKYWPDDPGASIAPDPETLDARDGVPLVVKSRSVVVDSTKAHEVEPFQGKRYSLVYFTIPNFQKCSQEAMEWLCKECEVPLPKDPVEDQTTWRQAAACQTAAGRNRRERTPWKRQEQEKKIRERRQQLRVQSQQEQQQQQQGHQEQEVPQEQEQSEPQHCPPEQEQGEPQHCPPEQEQSEPPHCPE